MSAILLGLGLMQLTSVPPQDADAWERRVTPVVRVVQGARPAVVYIQTNVPSLRRDFFGRVFRENQQSSGSGVVIYEEGYIVTNYHVVKGANEIVVRFDPAISERVYEAQLISFNEAEDLALLKIDGEDPFPTVPLGISSDLMIGETVLAIGNPYGQTLSVSQGIISGLHRNVNASGLSFSNLIQTDASINPGNSGGPLLNINGDLIGINTVVNTAAENIGFAIPVDQVQLVLREHLLSPSKARGWLGFEVDLDRLTIEDVTAGGPAASEGLEVGDRVVALNGKPLETAEDYRLARVSVQPGEEVSIRVRRGALSRSYDLLAWDRADYITYRHAGMVVQPVVINTSRAVRLTKVRPGGPAAELGLQAEDIIEAVQPEGRRAQRIGSADELALLLTRLKPGTEMRVDIWRDENQNGRLDFTKRRSEAYKGFIAVE
ncbi:MAG: trypsin-like peptidase domain-containing protein [Planctomycetota bacterium]